MDPATHIQTGVSRFKNHFNTFHTFERRTDGKINVTKMCQDNNKLWANFIRQVSIDPILNEISSALSLPKESLVDSKVHHGTWADPHVAFLLGNWISPNVGMALRDVYLHDFHLNEATLQQQLNEEIANRTEDIQRNKDFEERLHQALIEIDKWKKEASHVKSELDQQCGVRKRYLEWESDWRTVYEHVLKSFRVKIPEKVAKAVDKVVTKNYKAKYSDDVRVSWTQSMKYHDLIDGTKSMRIDTEVPPLPVPVAGFSMTPRTTHTYKREDWHLIEEQIEMYRSYLN